MRDVEYDVWPTTWVPSQGPHVCWHCRREFMTDAYGRRESDWIISSRFCSWDCNIDYLDSASVKFRAAWMPSRCPVIANHSRSAVASLQRTAEGAPGSARPVRRRAAGDPCPVFPRSSCRNESARRAVQEVADRLDATAGVGGCSGGVGGMPGSRSTSRRGHFAERHQAPSFANLAAVVTALAHFNTLRQNPSGMGINIHRYSMASSIFGVLNSRGVK